MKALINHTRQVVKGMPSGVAASILFHFGLFMVAGMLIVITSQPPPRAAVFVRPVATERKPIELVRPHVNFKDKSKPQAMSYIVTPQGKTDSPVLELPSMQGNMLGEIEKIGIDVDPGFDTPPLETVFGDPKSIGNDFEGTFYDLKRDRTGKGVPMSDYQFVEELTRFAKNGWKTSALSRFYRAPTKLFAKSFMMPPIPSSLAPAAFGEPDTLGYAWLIHYKGQLVSEQAIRFRFWGQGDDVMVVRVAGKVVLNACWPDESRGTENIVPWRSSSTKSRQYYLGNNKAVVGDWITLDARVPREMEVVIGEVPGGTFCSMLVVEVDGVDYPKNRQGMPVLPAFKTAAFSSDLIDAISEHLVADEVSITDGPVFCDFSDQKKTSGFSEAAEPEDQMVPVELPIATARIWTGVDGQCIEAEYVNTIGGNAILRDQAGRQIKVPLSKLSSDDLQYMELENPPALDITFTKQSSQRVLEVTPYLSEEPPRLLEYVFGVKVRQTSAAVYNHELKVEYYAIGQQLLDDQKYRLLDRKVSSFVPGKENRLSHSFSGNPVELMSYELDDSVRGMKYAGNLVVVTDKRGKIVQYNASSKWLFDNLDKLRELPTGAFMDETCARVHPTGPKTSRY